MSLEELISVNLIKEFTVSEGMNLLQVSRLIYNSDAGRYHSILKRLNNRFDWSKLKPGIRIKYIEKTVIDRDYEYRKS